MGDVMLIDLNLKNEYIIDETYEIPMNYYENSEVKKLDKVKVSGKIFYDANDDISANLTISGVMTLLDDISLDEVNYPFSIEYDEKIEKNLINDENKLDLFEFLWENIVLEVPLKFTEVKDLSKFHGNGWKLVSEDDKSNDDNPFSELLKNFDKKE